MGAPPWQSLSVPVCSTVPLLYPSIPTQKLEYWFVDGQVPCIVGTIHDPLASLTEPAGPVTAKPLQLVLLTLSLWIRGATVNDGAGSAAAKVTMERMMSADAEIVEVI